MNKDSISHKVTSALCTAAKDGCHDYDIKDAEDVIDDILSCTKFEFLGNATKKYFNTRNLADPMNDKMCTVPVRMDFRDRNSRIQAEINLRKICRTSCSVPYPKKLRAMLNELVREGKKSHPNCFIKTRVNVDNLTVDAQAKTDKGWVDLNLVKTIPLNILDNNPLTPSLVASQVAEEETAEMTEDEEISLS
jgi:hypothetical protein